jgi:hypothetical protein
VTPGRRRHLPAIGALVLLALAVLLVLFALDVRTWQGTVQRDDLRFRSLPGTPGLWRPSTILPGDPAGLVLSAGDTTVWRNALQAFWLARLGLTPRSPRDQPLFHSEAERELQGLMVDGRTVAERSDAANLLGILSLTTSAPTPAGDFRQAIMLDPSNAQAKQNLELTLRLAVAERPPQRRRVRTGNGFGHGRDSARTGNGY